MKKILLTGFEPFLSFKENPSEQIVEFFSNNKINSTEIVGEVLPVDFSKAGKQIINYIDKHKPDIVLSLGIAKGRAKITPERIAINCNAGPKDNRGFEPGNEKIFQDGPDGLFSTLPIQKIVKDLQNNNIPASISNSAGTYLCNNVMYHSLYYIHKNELPIQAGFIHLPLSHSLALSEENVPSWSLDDLIKGINLCLSSLTEARTQ